MASFVDASPLIGLARIDHLDLLVLLPPPVNVTTAVWDEVVGDPNRPGVAALRRAEATGIFTVTAQGDAADYPFLGRGEAQTLSAARNARAAVLLDDAEARRFLRADPTLVATVPSTLTTVGLIVLAKRRGAIPRVQTLLDALIAQRLYVHPAVYQQALRAVGEWPPA